jgi:WD40 repeat protein
MASVSADNKIKIWELKQGRLGWTVFGHEGEIRTIEFNEKGDYFATGGDDKLVMIWNSNFDRDLNNSGRGIETNFKEKANGDGLQPLFKSNKLSADLPSEPNFSMQADQLEKNFKPVAQSERSSVHVFPFRK